MKKTQIMLLAFFAVICLWTSGCNSGNIYVAGGNKDSGQTANHKPDRDNTPKVLTPVADGVTTYEDGDFSIDASHTDQGYVMVRYSGTKTNEKLQIDAPDGTTYTYVLAADGQYDAFPFSSGDGTYSVKVYDNVKDENYALALSQDLTVTLADEFLPFLYANQYVAFDSQDQVITKGQELAEGTHSDVEVIEQVYNYITSNITYDEAKARSVTYGYLPNPDKTLSSGTGICFDYAALMTAMLRSQSIPTKLEIGYYGDIYHAWISTYVDDKGWVDNIIEFDGTSWKLMDPTNAAANNTVDYETQGDSPYVVKYSY